MASRTPYLPSEPLPGEDWFADDPALSRFLRKRLPATVWEPLEKRLSALGQAAPAEVDPLAREADRNGPTLADDGTVVLSKSYREIQRLAREHEVFTLNWRSLGGAAHAPRLATFGLGYLFSQAEAGYYCPACMTDGAAFVLERHAPDLATRYLPRLVQTKAQGAYEGAMFLTERAGGSDVGATETVADHAPDGSWRVTGDKWFCSNTNAECILALARMPEGAPGTRGLGLFLIPSHLPDGSPNPGLLRRRLKEKLGVRSMATGEVDLRDAYAELVAGEGHGFKAMAEMVNLSRLYNAVTSVAIARRALREGQKNGVWRNAFGKPLREHALYTRAVASLALDVRGALYFVLDTADAFDKAADGDSKSYRLLRALTPLAKAETARLSVRAASEACEMLGGNGYIEEWVTPRLLRDAQVLPIWEGTGNIQALDFMRACRKDGAAQALVDDSLRLLEKRGDLGARLTEAWHDWASDAASPASEDEQQMSAARLLTAAYHLRCATLLAADATNETTAAFARGYYLKHIVRDESEVDALVLEHGATLAGWPQ